MKRILIVFIPFLLLFLSACSIQSSSAPKIEVAGNYVNAVLAMDSMNSKPESSTAAMPAMGGGNGGAYMLIKNSGGAPDKLIKVESDVAGSAEVHQTLMKGDVMLMNLVDELEIPANGQVEFKPGSYHIMLIGLTQDLLVGSKVSLTLSFEKSGKITVGAEVKKP